LNSPINDLAQHNTSSIFKGRVLSIDAFRGITILIMIFVNTLAGVSGVPAWMEHMPSTVDGMTFVDVVFPAFLFIVGMSIPFALAQHATMPFWKKQQHIVLRAAGLIVLGVFMVNAEEGYNEAAMHMSISLWSLLFYLCAILIWNVYSFKNTSITAALRLTGIVGLVILGWQFRGGPNGELHLAPQWWGILGLIGWAYLYGCIVYQLGRGKIAVLLGAIAFCVAYYSVGHLSSTPDSLWFAQTENGSHTSIVLTGILCSVIFFDRRYDRSVQQRYLRAALLIVAMLIVGYFLRPYFKISKNEATPTWCLYSSAICVALFGLFYWLIDLKKIQGWTMFFKPAASNPLLTYLIPFIVYALSQYLNLSSPEFARHGLPGMLWSAAYAVLVMVVVMGLNRYKIRLQL